MNVSTVEDLEFRPGTSRLNHLSHDPDVSRRIDYHSGSGKHGVEIECRDFWLEGRDVFNPSFRRYNCRGWRGNAGMLVARHIAAPRPGRQVDDDIAATCPD